VRRLIVPVVVTLVLALVVVVGIFPTRRYLSQRQAIAAGQGRVEALTSSNDTMQAQVDRLQTDAEIEKQARTYGWVKRGEEPYHILPTPQDPPKVPDVWPFDQLQQRLDR
jgi:cell division protein FtsB